MFKYLTIQTILLSIYLIYKKKKHFNGTYRAMRLHRIIVAMRP